MFYPGKEYAYYPADANGYRGANVVPDAAYGDPDRIPNAIVIVGPNELEFDAINGRGVGNAVGARIAIIED